jgi:hypothetical protein
MEKISLIKKKIPLPPTKKRNTAYKSLQSVMENTNENTNEEPKNHQEGEKPPKKERKVQKEESCVPIKVTKKQTPKFVRIKSNKETKKQIEKYEKNKYIFQQSKVQNPQKRFESREFD